MSNASKARSRNNPKAQIVEIDPIIAEQVLGDVISSLQQQQLTIEWVPHASIKPNKYNPNRMLDHDRMLLRQSLLEDGWTQPIVTLLDKQIVDGEQRWTVAGLPIDVSDVDLVIHKMQDRAAQGYPQSESILHRLDEARSRLQKLKDAGLPCTLAGMTGGLVPITRIDLTDEAHKMISTIRHNRAKGQHNLDIMASITGDLKQMGLDFDDLEHRLGMESEEIDRLMELASIPDQVAAQATGFSQAWAPVPLAGFSADELIQRGIERSAVGNQQAKAYELEAAQREHDIRQQVMDIVTRKEREQGRALDLIERQRIQQEVEHTTPRALPPPPDELRSFRFYVTPTEYAGAMEVLGDEPITGFLRLCREAWSRQHDGAEPTW